MKSGAITKYRKDLMIYKNDQVVCMKDEGMADGATLRNSKYLYISRIN